MLKFSRKLIHLALRMTHNTFGVVRMAREVGATTYDDCMIGSECVDWLTCHLELKRADAHSLLQHFVAEQLLVVVDAKSKAYDSATTIFRRNQSKLELWSTKYKKPIKIEVRMGEISVHLENFSSPKPRPKTTFLDHIPKNVSQTLLTERDWKASLKYFLLLF